MTVREMLARIDSRELSEWMAEYALNPWGLERADLRAGVIASTMANCMTDGGGFKPSDFVPKYGPQEEPEPMTDEQMKDTMMRFTGMMGGVIVKK